jgi:hypothetical protein
MDEFLESFGLKKYLVTRFNDFNNASELISEISVLQKQNHITTLIAYETPSKYLVDTLKKKFGIRIYILPQIEDDTSGW